MNMTTMGSLATLGRESTAYGNKPYTISVIPAKAGIPWASIALHTAGIPAFAGMTERKLA